MRNTDEIKRLKHELGRYQKKVADQAEVEKDLRDQLEAFQRGMRLYSMGFFSPERAQESLIALDMMDFEGVDEIREKVRQGQTLLNLVQQMAARMDQMAMVIQGATGLDMGLGGQSASGSPTVQEQKNTGGSPLANGVMQSQMPQTSYMQRMAQNAAPKME